jgi:hypothetical protein
LTETQETTLISFWETEEVKQENTVEQSSRIRKRHCLCGLLEIIQRNGAERKAAANKGGNIYSGEL